MCSSSLQACSIFAHIYQTNFIFSPFIFLPAACRSSSTAAENRLHEQISFVFPFVKQTVKGRSKMTTLLSHKHFSLHIVFTKQNILVQSTFCLSQKNIHQLSIMFRLVACFICVFWWYKNSVIFEPSLSFEHLYWMTLNGKHRSGDLQRSSKFGNFYELEHKLGHIDNNLPFFIMMDGALLEASFYI